MQIYEFPSGGFSLSVVGGVKRRSLPGRTLRRWPRSVLSFCAARLRLRQFLLASSVNQDLSLDEFVALQSRGARGVSLGEFVALPICLTGLAHLSRSQAYQWV